MNAIRQLLARIRTQLTELWERMEKKNRTRFLVISGACLLIIIVAVALLNRTTYVPLYQAELDPAAAGEIADQLEEMSVKYKTNGPGRILVPTQQRDQLLMSLAARGTVVGGDKSIFAEGSGLGKGDYTQRQYAKFQVEADLQRIIALYPGVRNCQVLIYEPDNASIVFASERQETTAAVMLDMHEGASLAADQVGAVENLVAAAVGMEPKNVSITDNYLKRLNNREASDYSQARSQYEFEQMAAADMARAISPILSAMFGADRVHVGVHLQFAWNEETKESITFLPVVGDEEGIARAIREVTETAQGTGAATGEPGYDDNGGAPEYPWEDGYDLSSYSNMTREINYEISQVVESWSSTPGTEIIGLTATIVIDNEELAQNNPSATAAAIQAIAGGVMGLQPAQYDSCISVQFQEFTGRKRNEDLRAQAGEELRFRQIMDLIKTLGLYALIALCLIILINRILGLFRGKKDEEAQALAEVEAARRAAETEARELEGLVALATGEELEEKRTAERERIEEFIDKNPEAVAQLLRSWTDDEPEMRRR